MTIEDRLLTIEKDIAEIKKRNFRVEANKRWEISLTRKILIAALTYTTILILLIIIKNEKPFLNAIIPSIAFIISTLSIDLVRRVIKK